MFFSHFEVRKLRRNRFKRQAIAEDFQEQRAAHQRGHQPDQQTVYNYRSDIRAQFVGDKQRRRMGRHHAVNRHQRRTQRDCQFQQRSLRLFGD
ncbi:hypothetical protein D3C72_946090 [compost metagenome]